MGHPVNDLHDAAWFDAQFERLAAECGAEAMTAASTIRREVLERCSHFDSFPGLAIAASSPDEFHAPAACYHVYPRFEGQALAAPRLVTLVAACGRNEGASSPGRLRHFGMREIVFIGPPAWVSRTRDEWMNRISAFAATVGLTTSLEPATDTFFGDPGRGRRLIQQLKTLKYELRTNAGELALASFNLHEAFFTSRFHITMADGSPAASGCAAFGLERWALASHAQRHACLR